MPDIPLTGVLVVAAIGMELGMSSPATSAALVVAGLLSVMLFPICALTLLRSGTDKVDAREPDQILSGR